jgi:hypothetical protein
MTDKLISLQASTRGAPLTNAWFNQSPRNINKIQNPQILHIGQL